MCTIEFETHNYNTFHRHWAFSFNPFLHINTLRASVFDIRAGHEALILLVRGKCTISYNKFQNEILNNGTFLFH
jgi:hypothetical protein